MSRNEREREATPSSWLSRAEIRSYTHPQLLKDTDVMSMAHSLEVRLPLLDDRLVRLMLGLPEGIKREGSGPKPLLVAAAGDLLPPRVLVAPLDGRSASAVVRRTSGRNDLTELDAP